MHKLLDNYHGNASPQTKRGFERQLAFVLSATELFFEKGYDAVSLDDIVNHAGGSKASIYKYFGNKDGLFKAICDYRRDLFFQELFEQISFENEDLKSLLTLIQQNFYQHIIKIENQKFIRLMFERVKYNPELSTYVYEECPAKILTNVSDKLKLAHEQGVIVCENPLFAAQMYLGILWHFEWKIFMGMSLTETDDQVYQYITYSVELFLKSLQYQQEI
ncbi:MAG: TetR/AcrR family transcriptional regulator [Acinetobacter sp.]